MGRVYVVGSINYDMTVQTARFPLPGETLMARRFFGSQGGKGANQAIAAARAGAESAFAGAVGDDAFGPSLVKSLQDAGVHTQMQSVPGASSGVAVITVDARGENQILVTPGANASLKPEAAAVFADGKDGDWLMIQNEIPFQTNCAVIEQAKRQGVRVALNSAPAAEYPPEVLKQIDLVIVNERELQALFPQSLPKNMSPAAALDVFGFLEEQYGPGFVLTLGARGVVGVWHGAKAAANGRQVKAVDSTGAGDCFCGYLIARLAQGDGFEQAVSFANDAAALSVMKTGAAVSYPAYAEVQSAFR